MVGHVSTSTMFQRFMHSQVVGALILIAMTVIALIWANSATTTFFHKRNDHMVLPDINPHISEGDDPLLLPAYLKGLIFGYFNFGSG